jgi:hypothetical protein
MAGPANNTTAALAVKSLLIMLVSFWLWRRD